MTTSLKLLFINDRIHLAMYGVKLIYDVLQKRLYIYLLGFKNEIV